MYVLGWHSFILITHCFRDESACELYRIPCDYNEKQRAKLLKTNYMTVFLHITKSFYLFMHNTIGIIDYIKRSKQL